MDRGVAVFGDHALADQDRVLEVVAVPGHERDQHVLADGDFAEIGGGTVRDHVTLFQFVALLHDGTLVDIGVLVRTLVFDEVVDVHTHFTSDGLGIVDTDHDAGGVHIVHHTTTGRRHDGARVHSGHALDPGADQRLLGAQHGHSLAGHVGAHQCAVRVIVLQEGHQRCRHRHDLRGRHVHVLDAFGTHQDGFALFTRRHQLTGQAPFSIQRGIGLGDDVLAFFDGRKVVDLVGDLAIGHATVRRFNEAIFVQAGVEGQRVDQADVRAFRRFDRADAAVVRDVHVAHFEAGTFARQTARAQG